MKTIDLRLPAAALLGVALTLSACSRDGGSGAENAAPASAAPDAAADPGRGAMLNTRIDAAVAAVGQATTSGALPQETADRLNGELVAIRGDLSAALSSDPGPLSPDQRQALSDRLAKVEAELAASPPAAQP
jgi:hypothetical protein